jgi:hypothetical protein
MARTDKRMSSILTGLRIILLAGGVFLLTPVLPDEAATYVYVDSAGTAHFTDAPGESPALSVQPLLGVERPSDPTTGAAGYTDLIRRIAAEERVDPELVQAIIQVESNFDTLAVSRKGARGLMQLMPATAVRYAVPDVFDPEANIRGGVQFLRALHGRFPGRLPLVLAAFNAGENAVVRHGGIPPYAETRRYVERVLALYERRQAPVNDTTPRPPIPVAAPEASGPTAPVPTIIQTVDAHGTLVYTTSSLVAQPPHGSSR